MNLTKEHLSSIRILESIALLSLLIDINIKIEFKFSFDIKKAR